MGAPLPPIARALREARTEAKLSQQELADASGVAKPTIANIERGVHRTVRVSTLERLAEALNCQVSDLMGAEANPDADVVSAFLQSPMARELAVTKKESNWLLGLRINWQGVSPSQASIMLLLLAHRSGT